MAKTLKELTRVGTDARKIAALLQAKAPPGHRLAYINEREAALLKDAGGSGHIDPETGIQSFEDEPPEPGQTVLPDVAYEGGEYAQAPEVISGVEVGGPQYQPEIAPTELPPVAGVQPQDLTRGIFARGGAPAVPVGGVAPGAQPAGVDFAALQGLKEYEQPPGTTAPTPAAAPAAKGGLTEGQRLAAALGTSAIGGLLGLSQARRAGGAVQAGAQQMKDIAAPYQAQGQALQAAAQRGELTPQAQQSLQAAQAQLRQGIEARGGVGVAQATQQLESLRQNLLAQQYQLGLQVSGIGDQIALGAIRTGMQADQQYAQMYGNFINNMARAATGALIPQQQVTLPRG